VHVNGSLKVVGTDYTFDQPSNSIIFTLAPPAAAVITADYDALCF
jgi:hypothetical protein